MLIRIKIWVALALTLLAAGFAAFGVATGFGTYTDQTGNGGNAFSSAPSFPNTGYRSPTADYAARGGNDDGFEEDPTYAYADDALYAVNHHGPGDVHVFYGFGVAPPAGSTVEGVRVRLDWWLNDDTADNGLSAELSWDGGTTWTAAKTDTVETTSEHTGIVGGAGDTWGRVWTPDELNDSNFRVRLTCQCTGSAECNSRDFYLDWVAVNVYYSSP
jgi:hypothetical protein